MNKTIYQAKTGGVFGDRRVVVLPEVAAAELHWGTEGGVPRALMFTASEARRTAEALIEAASAIEASSTQCECGERVDAASVICIECSVMFARRRHTFRAVL